MEFLQENIENLAKPLDLFDKVCYNKPSIKYFRMTHAGNGAITAEGVTLSGVRKDEDCMPTELWRRPRSTAEAEGASAPRANSQAKGQSAMTPRHRGGIVCLLFVCVEIDGSPVCGPSIFLWRKQAWKRFSMR